MIRDPSVLPLTLVVGLAVLAVVVAAWWQNRDVVTRRVPREPLKGRRAFLAKAGSVVALAVTTAVLRPMAAFATHRRCEHRGVSGAYRTCLGQCSFTNSKCCQTSPNGVYRDCCSGGCAYNCRYKRLVVFQIDSSGGCFCYLESC